TLKGRRALVVAESLRPAFGREAFAMQERDHLRLGVGREPERVADAAVIRQSRAGEADDCAGEKDALPGKAEKRLRIGGRAQAGRDHIGEDEPAAGLEL